MLFKYFFKSNKIPSDIYAIYLTDFLFNTTFILTFPHKENLQIDKLFTFKIPMIPNWGMEN